MRYVFTALVAMAFFRAAGADAAEVNESRTMDKQRAAEVRALVDAVLLETDLQSTELMADVSLSGIDWHFNLGAFQEEERAVQDRPSRKPPWS